MNTLTRRRFLIASGAAAVAAGGAVVSWPELQARAVAAPLPAGTPILVLVTLYGGNDGLNTVIPYTDSAYHRLRPNFSYGADEVLPLDAALGLNPALKNLHSAWGGGTLAVVRGVGYPQPDHSHFRSMDIWQTASPQTPVNTGWVGRWLDATGDDPTRAVNIGAVLPPLAVGARASAACLPLGKAAPLPAPLAAACTALGVADPHDTPEQGLVAASFRAERTVAATFAPVTDPTAPDDDQDSPGGSAGGANDLSRQLDLVARCISAGVPTTVYTVSLGGFDTHADEKATQQGLLGVLDTALGAFLAKMASDPRGRSAVVACYSEFGRRVQANASQGTDHGTAAPMLIAGAPVKGGFFGEQPSLTDLDAGDLKATVDFRTVYAELLHSVVRTDPTPIVGATAAPLGFLR
jgi:uncharacterized protein (DUF1501 family)